MGTRLVVKKLNIFSMIVLLLVAVMAVFGQQNNADSATIPQENVHEKRLEKHVAKKLVSVSEAESDQSVRDAMQAGVIFDQSHSMLSNSVNMAISSRQFLYEFYKRELTAWVSPVVHQYKTNQYNKTLRVADIPRTITEPHVQQMISKVLTGKDYLYHDGLGLSQAMTLNLLTLQRPIRYSLLTSSFGWRHGRAHYGTDFASPVGTPIYAAESGQVVYTDWYYDYGKFIKISHGKGITTHYAHCQTMLVKPGEWVSKGQQIATIGMTGRSTGAHVHFELAVDGVLINPEHYIASEVELAEASLFMLNRVEEADNPFAETLYENPTEISFEF